MAEWMFKEVVLTLSIFDDKERTVTRRSNEELLGTVTEQKEGFKAKSNISGDEIIMGTLKGAIVFLLRSKKATSKKIKHIPGQRMLIDLLS